MAPQKAVHKAPVLEAPREVVPRSPALVEPRGRKRGANSDLAATLFKRVAAPRPQESLSASDKGSSPPESAPRGRVVRDVLSVFQSDPISSSRSDSGSLPGLGQASNSQDIFEIVQFSGRPDDTSDTAPTSPVGHPKTATPAADKTGSNPAPPDDVRHPPATAMSHGNDSIAASCAPASNNNYYPLVPRIVPATGSDRPPPQRQPSPMKPRVVLASSSGPLDAIRKHTNHVPPNFPPAGGLLVEPAAQRSPASAQAPRPCIVVPSSSSSSPEPSPQKPRPRSSEKLTLPQIDLSGDSPVASGSDGGDGPSHRRDMLQTISRIVASSVDDLNRKEASLDMVTDDFLRLAQTVDKLCRVHQQEQADLILRYRQQCDHVVQNLENAHKEIEESLPGPDLFDFGSIIADARSRSSEAKRALSRLDFGH
ncbi:hypothetical protein MAPG_03520 [Magnaporthiopsis poae ATCC 64411]|uniref:Uncharacterized protein n=1 Tax=Magnaporthiopsis poae (strain ATCC 64411 / 73-15) TaxID=644358 RepID=A0A0C4DU82_MAGP6|nr:hypothetical protein MAPG_03520 [Magnaporthiopsis poae ATCC 64411]